jgi:hypothetical protein
MRHPFIRFGTSSLSNHLWVSTLRASTSAWLAPLVLRVRTPLPTPTFSCHHPDLLILELPPSHPHTVWPWSHPQLLALNAAFPLSTHLTASASTSTLPNPLPPYLPMLLPPKTTMPSLLPPLSRPPSSPHAVVTLTTRCHHLQHMSLSQPTGGWGLLWLCAIVPTARHRGLL